MKNVQTVQGLLFLALLAVPMFVRELGHWPLYLLVPLVAYAVIVCSIPSLRSTPRWARVGRVSYGVVAATAAIILISSSALVLYQALFRPNLQDLAAQLPTWLPVHWIVVGVVFCTLNALLEEIVFRGILYDALDAELGARWALVVQAAAFGVGHAQGYPPGAVGILLASAYGILLGWLRQLAQGLGAAVVAHIFADATIFAIIVSPTP
jgi:membrane protease YdiL (CAAX protease family)